MGQFSKESVIHCPHQGCGKMLLSQLSLWEGSTFLMRCASCRGYVRIQATFNVIIKRAVEAPSERSKIDHG